jgi:hypothetical protein
MDFAGPIPDRFFEEAEAFKDVDTSGWSFDRLFSGPVPALTSLKGAFKGCTSINGPLPASFPEELDPLITLAGCDWPTEATPTAPPPPQP